MLTGSEIKSKLNNGIVISPFNDDNLGTNSYDLTLGPKILRLYGNEIIDSRNRDSIQYKEVFPENDNSFVIMPGQLYLCETAEYTETVDFIPCISGRSSFARIGLSVHQTAGFGDIGYCGKWTLEISSIKPTRIYVGQRICQIYFYKPEGQITKFYSGKYQINKFSLKNNIIMESKSYDD